MKLYHRGGGGGARGEVCGKLRGHQARGHNELLKREAAGCAASRFSAGSLLFAAGLVGPSMGFIRIPSSTWVVPGKALLQTMVIQASPQSWPSQQTGGTGTALG